MYLQDRLTFLPLALSYLLCFPLPPCVFLFFCLTFSALQVMLWFTPVGLPFPFA